MLFVSHKEIKKILISEHMFKFTLHGKHHPLDLNAWLGKQLLMKMIWLLNLQAYAIHNMPYWKLLAGLSKPHKHN